MDVVRLPKGSLASLAAASALLLLQDQWGDEVTCSKPYVLAL